MSKAGEFSVSIEAQSPACFVWLVAKDVRGRFSENGFLLTEPFKTVRSYFTLQYRSVWQIQKFSHSECYESLLDVSFVFDDMHVKFLALICIRKLNERTWVEKKLKKFSPLIYVMLTFNNEELDYELEIYIVISLKTSQRKYVRRTCQGSRVMHGPRVTGHGSWVKTH